MRRCVLTALVLLTAVAPAHATPRALTRSDGLLAIAGAGDQVLVARRNGANLRVSAIPLSGGTARQVFSFDAPNGLRPESAALDASAQRAALTIEMGEEPGRIDAVQTFAGPVAGGWSELQPFTELGRPGAVSPLRQQVDGERIFTTESRGDDVRVVVRDPDPHEVAFASGENPSDATFAGDLVAYGTGDNGLVVRDWRSGAVVHSTQLPNGFGSIALRPDGRAALTAFDGPLYEVRPGAPPRLLARLGGSKAAYAGDSLVFDPGDRLRVIDPAGRIRRLGAPTWSLGGFATEGSRVIWLANGCVLVDDVSAPPAAAPDPGPCPRSEIALDPRRPDPYLTRTLSVPVRCVAAPRACRGSLRLTTRNPPADAVAISRRVRFSILAGHTRRIHVPLTCRGYRLMRRSLANDPDAIVALDARTDDGERFPGDPWYQVSSGPAEVIRGCDGPTVEPTGLPASVDAGPLRGTALTGTPCTFARDVHYGNPGDGTIRLSLDCADAQNVGRRGFVDVERVQSGHGIPEDELRCVTERDRDPSAAPEYSCELWHGKIALYTRAWCARRCNAEERARAREAARVTMTRFAERVATLPEQPCRLCPKYFPPERVQQLTRTFSGSGPKELGTIRVKVDSRIDYYYAQTGGMRVTSGRPPRVLMKAKRHQGQSQLPRGTYRNVKVIASGDWTLTVAPR